MKRYPDPERLQKVKGGNINSSTRRNRTQRCRESYNGPCFPGPGYIYYRARRDTVEFRLSSARQSSLLRMTTLRNLMLRRKLECSDRERRRGMSSRQAVAMTMPERCLSWFRSKRGVTWGGDRRLPPRSIPPDRSCTPIVSAAASLSNLIQSGEMTRSNAR